MRRDEIVASFERVLTGIDGQVDSLPHPWLTVLAQNHDRHVALVVKVTLRPEQIIGDGHGFTVKTERGGKDDYVRVTCTDDNLLMFSNLVEYAFESSVKAKSFDTALSAFIDAIDYVRRYGVTPRMGRLSEEEIRGIFAELLLLRALIDGGHDIGEVIAAWRGPFALVGIGLHDFTFPDGRGIEVKSTRQPPSTVIVSSPTQLQPSGTPLDLVVLPLENVAQGTSGIGFRDLVIETGAIVQAHSQASADQWDGALKNLHLEPTDEWYNKWRFRPGDWLRFSVTNGFPYIDLVTIPPGIVNVKYALELQRLAPFTHPFVTLVQKQEV
jgi:hypothetical protein